MNRFHLQIHNDVHAAATRVRDAEANLFEKVRLADTHGTFRAAGYGTLWEYLTENVKLTKEMASNCITVLHKSKECPKLGELVANGELQISKARRVTSVLTPENQTEWLQAAVSNSKHELEKMIAEVKPETKVREVAKPVAQNTYQITICANEKQFRIFERLMSIASQKLRRRATQGEMLEMFGEEILRRFDPVEKARRAELRTQKREIAIGRANETRRAGSETNRHPALSAHVKHQVYLRDHGRCTHISDGKRCNSDLFTEIHHRIARHEGGTDSLENLTTLCWAHHSLVHQELYRDQNFRRVGRREQIRPGPNLEGGQPEGAKKITGELRLPR